MPSVQAAVEAALGTVRREATRLTVAGRTDAGVHARGQVASHAGAPARAESLNALLPPDIRVLASEEADPDFDARRDALSRTYQYRVLTRAVASPFERNYAFHVPRPLDAAALDACAAALRGTHDFTAFTPTETDHVRFERDVFRAEWIREPILRSAAQPALPAAEPDRDSPANGEIHAFWIEADTFMRHMVRVLVGTMLAVARGRWDVDYFERLLEGRPRSEAAETAPPHALFLEEVRYPGS